MNAKTACSESKLGDIVVRGEIGRRIDAMLANNILKIDIDNHFLKPFVENRQWGNLAYIGVGKLLLALVQYERYTKGSEGVRRLRKHVAGTLMSVQQADGYIGFHREPIPERMVKCWSTHELAYIVQGLIQAHLWEPDETVLSAAKLAAKFLLGNWDSRADKTVPWWMTQYIGLPAAMLMMHRATGEPHYLDFVTNDLRVGEWHPTIENHAYTHLSHNLEQLWLHRLSGDPALLRTTDEVMEFLRRHDGALITGGIAQMEFWHNTQECCGNSVESCAIAYLLRVLHERYLITPSAWSGDFVERVIWNALRAAQAPSGRRLRYHTPAEGPRTYYTMDVYCCPGNLRRIMPEIAQMIYYPRSDGSGFIVNQYLASEGQVELGDGQSVGIKMETDYPYSGEIRITIIPRQAAQFEVALRIPGWSAAGGMKVRINEEDWASAGRDGFQRLRRTWHPGDRIEVKFTLDFRVVEGRRWQAGTYAIMRGPVVYTLNPDLNPALKDVSPQVFHRLILDPATIRASDSCTVEGFDFKACIVRGWRPGVIQARRLDVAGHPCDVTEEFVLTEFADPGGVQTYFRVRPGYGSGVMDELLAGRIAPFRLACNCPEEHPE